MCYTRYTHVVEGISVTQAPIGAGVVSGYYNGKSRLKYQLLPVTI